MLRIIERLISRKDSFAIRLPLPSEQQISISTGINEIIQSATQIAASDAIRKTNEMRHESRGDGAILSELLFSLWSQANTQQALRTKDPNGWLGPDPNGTTYYMQTFNDKISVIAKKGSLRLATMFENSNSAKKITSCAVDTEVGKTTLLRFRNGKVYEAMYKTGTI